MNLWKAEARRFAGRRFIQAMLALIVVIMGIAVVSIAANTAPISEDDRAWARQQAAQRTEMERQWLDQEFRNCNTAQLTNGSPNYPAGFDCRQIYQKMGPEYPEDMFLPQQFDFHDEIFEALMIATTILALFGFVAGASYVGAEWTSGGMTNLLLWRPRRLEVHTAKLGTALGAVLAISVAYLALWTGLLYLVAATRGQIGQPDPDGPQLLWTCLRAVLLALGTTAVGAALAALGRHTAAALGVAIGYALVLELGGYLLLELTGLTYPDRFRLSSYVAAWMLGELRLYEPWVDGDGTFVIGLPLAGSVLGIVVALVVGASYWSAHRRDVA